MLRMLMAIGLALIVVGGVAACGSEPTVTPEPTEVRVAESLPTVAPKVTEEPTEAVDSTDGMTMPTSLEGPLWTLVAYGDPAAPTRLITDTVVTVQFTDGNFSGNAGCNGYFGGYTSEGNTLSIGMPGATLQACQEDIMAQEQAYLTTLQMSEIYSLNEGRLLINAAGGQFLLYEAEIPVSLAGSNWIVTSYNNGDEAMVSVITGSELTAEFTDEKISGNAGCNDYNATYEATDETIKIGPAITTSKECSEPEGIMEQEQQFLAALETAEFWRIETGILEMRTVDAAGAVTLEAAPEE